MLDIHHLLKQKFSCRQNYYQLLDSDFKHIYFSITITNNQTIRVIYAQPLRKISIEDLTGYRHRDRNRRSTIQKADDLVKVRGFPASDEREYPEYQSAVSRH